jgi:thiamine-phosphate diphosphorylase
MLQLPPLYPITDAARPEALSAQIRRLGEAGFPLVQFRGKPLDLQTQWQELRLALREARDNGGWPLICVNDRADLAVLAAQEGLAPWGLHLGQGDLPAAEAARLPGLSGCHLGASTHAPAEWAELDPTCDHAGVGPFRGTSTKPDHAAPLGLPGLQAGCEALRGRGVAPIAIGGLRLEDASACYSAGAEALAMVGEVHQAADPAALGWAAQRLRWHIRPPFKHRQGVVILGGSGAGKSTLGRLLAEGLACPFHDLDEVLASRTGRSIPDIFTTQGEGVFRQLETALLPELLSRPGIIVLGGGAWEAEANRRLVAQAGFAALWLAETPTRAWQRVGQDPNRPLAQEREAFLARWAQRMAAWSTVPMALPFGHSAEELATDLLESVD